MANVPPAQPTYKSGAWQGFFVGTDGQKRDVTCILNFQADLSITGTGMDAIIGVFKLRGFAMIQPPFTCSAELNPVNNYAHLITLNGQREIGESGEINLIGEWRDQNQLVGKFSFSPVVDFIKASKIMEQFTEYDDRLKTLTEMGYPRELCMRAVQFTSTMEDSMSWITSRLGQHGPESIPAAVLGDDAILIVHQASQKDIQQIMELGFSAEEAKNALAISNNNVDRAIELLLG